MTRVVVVRHGETDWNRNKRMQGWAPVPLNETGREQAAAVGTWLADEYEYEFDRAFSSDLLRTKQTTEILLEATGEVPVSFDSTWRERNLGVYQGLSYSDVEDRFPSFGLHQTAYEAIDAIPEGGESFRDVQTRVVDGFEELASVDAESVLLVTHGGPLCILLGHAKGYGLTESLYSHRPDNCSVSEFRVEDDITLLKEAVPVWEREKTT